MLFLIFCSILILISGVVLLTNKKPDPQPKTAGFKGSDDATTMVSLPPTARRRARSRVGDEEEGILAAEGEGEGAAPWQLGNASDDEEDFAAPRRAERPWAAGGEGERARMLEDAEHDVHDDARESTSSDATLARPDHDGAAYTDDFDDWKASKASS